MTKARIFQPTKTAMQSGRARTQGWVLALAPESARGIDPLMGWTSSSDMGQQVQLNFATLDEAIEYAKRTGLDFEVADSHARRIRPRAYADNFRPDRVR
jgi:hypothetical protein